MRIDEENIYNNNFDSLLALGLMSGTSLDGVDVALLSTDGNKNIISRGYSNFNFPKRLKNKIENVADIHKNLSPVLDVNLDY